MINRQLQIQGLWALAAFAVIILGLMAWTFWLMKEGLTADGQVPAIDAGTFTGLSLMFREVLSNIKSIWEYEGRANLTGQLQESLVNGGSQGPTGKVDDPIHTVTEDMR